MQVRAILCCLQSSQRKSKAPVIIGFLSCLMPAPLGHLCEAQTPFVTAGGRDAQFLYPPHWRRMLHAVRVTLQVPCIAAYFLFYRPSRGTSCMWPFIRALGGLYRL